MFLKTDAPAPPGTRLTVAVTTPEGTTLDLQGEVSYAQDGSAGRDPGMGVRLHLDTATSQELLRLYDLAVGAMAQPEPIPAWPCPRCATLILGNYTFCTNCGASADERGLGDEVETAVDALVAAAPPASEASAPAPQIDLGVKKADTGRFILDAEMLAAALWGAAPAAQRKDPTGEFWLPPDGPPARSAPAAPAPPPEEHCAECGSGVKTGQRFCFQCGAPVALSCPRCHAPARPSDKFCLTCGSPLRGSAVILR